MKRLTLVSGSGFALVLLAGMAIAQTDPGVQGAGRGTGAALPSVLANNPSGVLSFFNDGLSRFQAVESVSNSPKGNNGLGPRFNSNSCSSCHAQPAVGGTGPAVNPEFLFSSNGVAPGNTVPTFITANGPTREARFPFFFNQNGNPNPNAPNGGVEDIFTVTGRSDAGTCNNANTLPQPGFAQAQAANDIIFRIPTPTFGAGLLENLDDSTLIAVQLSEVGNNFGISGTFNHNGNDGTISRFGWKAQNKSLLLFAGEAYNVEMGISNELFTQDRPLPGEDQQGTGLPTTCLNLGGKGYPEDTSNPTPPPTVGVLLNGSSVSAAAISAGSSLFSAIGCATCHNPTPGTTQVSNFAPA